MEVQAGIRYNRRDGEVSGVIEKRVDFSDGAYLNHTFIDGVMKYLPSGHWYASDDVDGCDLISEYVEPSAEPTVASAADEWGPWIGWNGGECPVDDGVIGQTMFLFEAEAGTFTGLLDHQAWEFVIAYRVKKEPEVREFDAWIKDGSRVVALEGANTRRAIITTQGDSIKARWADE